MGFCGCGLVRVRYPKSGDDEDVAQLGDHVGSGGLGLADVPGGALAVAVAVADHSIINGTQPHLGITRPSA